MKVIALVSGGKDSILCMQECVARGHEIVCFANLHPPLPKPEEKDSNTDQELDSFCFQTVGHHAVKAIAECANVPLRTRTIGLGQSIIQSLEYAASNKNDEVEEMFQLIQSIKEEFPEANAVCSGAILSDYQRLRVESVCSRLGLTSLAYLWQKSYSEVLRRVRDQGVDARLIKTATMSLNPKKHLGKSLASLSSLLESLAPDVHPAGEGGEFETIVLDCLLFKEKKLAMKNEQVVMIDDNEYAPVGFLRFDVEIVDKSEEEKALTAKLMEELAAETKAAVVTDGMDFLNECSGFDARALAGVGCPRDLHTPLTAATPLGDMTKGAQGFMSLRASKLSQAAAAAGDSTTTPEQDVEYILQHVFESVGGNAEGINRIYFVMIHSPSMAFYAQINSSYVKCFNAALANNTGSGAILAPPGRAYVALEALEEVVLDVYLLPTDLQLEGKKSVTEKPVAKINRKALHVQSQSAWAAPCIGPYAQTNTLTVTPSISKANPLLVVSGRISMVPSSQDLFEGPADGTAVEKFVQQFAGCLHNALTPVALLLFGWHEAAKLHKAMRHVTHATIFVTNDEMAKFVKPLWEHFVVGKEEEDESTTPVTKQHIRCVRVSALPKKASVEMLLQVWNPSKVDPMDDESDEDFIDEFELAQKQATTMFYEKLGATDDGDDCPLFQRPY